MTALTVLLTVSIALSILALVADGIDARKYRKALRDPEARHCSRCELYTREHLKADHVRGAK